MENELKEKENNIKNEIGKINKKINVLDKTNKFFLYTATIFGIFTALSLVSKYILFQEPELFNELLIYSLIPTATSGVLFIPGILIEANNVKKKYNLEQKLEDIEKEKELEDEVEKQDTYEVDMAPKTTTYENQNDYVEHIENIDNDVKVKVYKRK